MLRECRKMDFGECLNFEYQVLQNILNSEIKSLFFTKNSAEISRKLDQNFSKNKVSDFLKIQNPNLPFLTKKREILPLKNYYKKFSHVFLSYINQQNHHDIESYEQVEQLSRKIFFRYGIDTNNVEFDIPFVRKKMSYYFSLEEVKRKNFENVVEIAKSEKLQQVYFSDRKNAIEKFLVNENFEK